MAKMILNGAMVEVTPENTQHILLELYNRSEQHGILLTTIAAAQTSMAVSVQSVAESVKTMASTQEKCEARYLKLEDRLQATNDRAAGKNQIPLVSHLAILGSTVLITVLVVLYVHNQAIDASLTSIKVQPANKP